MPRAEALCEQVLTIFRAWNEPSWVAVSLLTRAGTQAARGDFVAAEESCAESVALYQAAGYVRGEAQAERDWCRCLAAQHLWEAAAEHGRQALFLFRKVGDRLGEASALVHLAAISLRHDVPGSRAQAQDYATAAAALQAKHQWPSLAT